VAGHLDTPVAGEAFARGTPGSVRQACAAPLGPRSCLSIWRVKPSSTAAAPLPFIFARVTKRILRSTSVPTEERLAAPFRRSPSQWPGPAPQPPPGMDALASLRTAGRASPQTERHPPPPQLPADRTCRPTEEPRDLPLACAPTMLGKNQRPLRTIQMPPPLLHRNPLSKLRCCGSV
jgi:hypothetical protein